MESERISRGIAAGLASECNNTGIPYIRFPSVFAAGKINNA